MTPERFPLPAPLRATGLDCNVFPMNTTVKLTAFQAEEVEGLLWAARDEQEISGERAPWGELVGDVLTVWDIEDAADDLENRAEMFESNYSHEGPAVRGQARSLRTLADKIRT